MILAKWKLTRRRFGWISNAFRYFLNCVHGSRWIIFILTLTFHQLALACGPGGGGTTSSGGNSRNLILGRSSITVDDAPSDGRLIWDINQWVPTDFRSASDQSVISALNPNLRNAFGDVIAKPFDSGTASTKPIVCPSDLACDFSNWRLCRWKNSKEDEAEFYVGEGSVDADRLQLYAGTRTTPNSPFLLTAANRGDYKAWLISDIVPDQPGDGTLEFRFWLTPLVELRVCTRPVENPDTPTCSESLNLSAAPGPVSVNIPGPIKEPFEIIFQVRNFVTEPGGVAFIDDITYTSSLCDEARAQKLKPVSRLSIAQKSRIDGDGRGSTNICDVVPCSFDAGSTCGYDLFGPGATSAWRIGRTPVGNRATGIHRDINGIGNSTNAFLLATGETKGLKDLFVAQSRPFHLDRSISLRFFRHMLSSTSQLRVCLFDASAFCPSTFRIDVDSLDWQESVVDINPADIPREFRTKPVTVLLVAEGLKQNNYIGIDNIEIRERNGSPAC